MHDIKKIMAISIISLVHLSMLTLFNGCGPWRTKSMQTQTVYIFSHGIADTHKQANMFAKSYYVNQNLYHNERYIIQDPFYSFNYPDATNSFWRINFWKTSLGQQNEIEVLARIYNRVVQKHPNANVVLVGVSRGASVIFNFCTKSNPDRVKAVILESPFDSIDHLIHDQCKRFHVPFGFPLSKKLPEFVFRNYKSNQIQPLDGVGKISHDIPILIVCSKEDKVIPYERSANLYMQLTKAGHDKAHLLVLDQGKHGFLFVGPDSEKYFECVNEFYKKYNLPYLENAHAA